MWVGRRVMSFQLFSGQASHVMEGREKRVFKPKGAARATDGCARDGRKGVEGQWIGSFEGSSSGTLVVDLDDLGDHWEGHAFAFDADTNSPNAMVRIRTPDKAKSHTLQIGVEDLTPLHPTEPIILNRLDLPKEVNFARLMDLSLKVVGSTMNIGWKADNDTSGTATALLSETKPSEYTARQDITTWSEFRDFALSLPPRRFIFRGQDCPHRLRTSFHRSRRKDLVGYLRMDMPNALHALTARTKHMFDLNKPVENAAFLNLLQHHGYPTPLLDWSYSPFVAAFFAYRRKPPLDVDHVRIFVFDKEAWTQDFRQMQTLTFAGPHFSILEALTIENLRAMPQQSVSSVSNIDHIEGYIMQNEALRQKTYLQVIDLPRSERRAVMEQLSLMGITAGSLFPGIDGACEELRGRYFHPFD